MAKSISVASLSKDWMGKHYNLFVVAVGYEERARYIAEVLSPRSKYGLGLGFDCQQLFEFDVNKRWFADHGFRVFIGDDFQCTAALSEWLAEPRGLDPLSILVDISSLSRIRLALLVEVFEHAVPNCDVTVDFVYALGAYTEPSKHSPANSHVGPVLPSFAGWWTEPDRAISAIVGLGYEQDRALGAVEHLQAADVWAFVPLSEVNEYTPEVRRANLSLLANVSIDHQLTYKVHDPLDCFQTIESLIYGLSLSRNPVLLPFGPKLFALCCLLVAVMHRYVPVWRVSAQEYEPAVNRRASGSVYGLTVIFNKLEGVPPGIESPLQS